MDRQALPESDRYSSFIQPLLMLMVDYGAIIIAEVLALFFRTHVLQLFGFQVTPYQMTPLYFLLWLPATFLVFLHWGRTYIRLMSVGEMIRRTFYSVCLSVVAFIVITFVANTPDAISRSFTLLLGIFVFLLVTLFRLALREMLNRLRLFLEPTIFIGSDITAQKLLRYSSNSAYFGIQVVGIIDDVPEGKSLTGKFPWLGPTSKAKEIVQKLDVNNVIVLAPRMEHHKLIMIIEELFPVVKNISYVPDTEELPISNMHLQPLYSEDMVVISVENNLSRRYNRVFKRVFDFVVALLGSIAISPFLLAIMAIIKYSDPGPLFYGHRRVGEDGKHFKCWKFRSMCVDSDRKLKEYLAQNPEARQEWEEQHKLKNDPRVTRIGHFLRKTSLDELPQLWNVIVGEMSLVGPRPIVDDEIIKYGTYFADYSLVKPGMTGLWQVSGRSDTSYTQRVRLDAWYVRNWNIWLDVGVILRTVKMLCSKQKGAY